MKSNFFKYFFFIIVFILIVLGGYILYKDGNSKTLALEENKKEINMINSLNIGVLGFDTINPILSNNSDSEYISKLVFEPLIDITKDFKTEYCLAQELSKINNTTYILKIRDDKFFHNGSKLTSQDVIFTIENLKNNNIDSIYKENVNDIESIQRIDDYTLKIMLNKEVDFLEYKLCIPILCKDTYEEGTLESKTLIPNGIGKYRIKSIEDSLIKMVVSDDNTKSNIKEINIILEKQTKDLYDDFINGKVDYIITENIDYEKYLGSFGYNVTIVPGRKYEYLALNNKNSLLGNIEVRKAINYALDRNSINYNVFNNKCFISDFPLGYGSYLYDNDNEIGDLNLNKAKVILIENGWQFRNNSWVKNGRTLRFNLVTNSEDEYRVETCKLIKEQLENIGIKVNVIEASKGSYESYLRNKNYDIIYTGNLVSNYPSLNSYFGEDNLSNYNNDFIGEILKDITNIDSKEVFKEKVLNIIDIYNEEVPFISLYFNNIFIISNKDLKGDLSCNWYNLFYNIDNWYKAK